MPGAAWRLRSRKLALSSSGVICNMVEQSGEPHPFIPTSRFPHTVKTGQHGLPALRPVRDLLRDVSLGSMTFLSRPAPPTGEGVAGVSRFPRDERPSMRRFSDSVASSAGSRFMRRLRMAFPCQNRVGTHKVIWLAWIFPCRTLHPSPHGDRRMTRGRTGSLLLVRAVLSSATHLRLSAALSLTPFLPRRNSSANRSSVRRNCTVRLAQPLPLLASLASSRANQTSCRALSNSLRSEEITPRLACSPARKQPVPSQIKNHARRGRKWQMDDACRTNCVAGAGDGRGTTRSVISTPESPAPPSRPHRSTGDTAPET
jgi:hypothetical protein